MRRSKDPISTLLEGTIADVRKDLTLEPTDQVSLKVEYDCMNYLKEELQRDRKHSLLQAIKSHSSEEHYEMMDPHESLFYDLEIPRNSLPQKIWVRLVAHFFSDYKAIVLDNILEIA